MTTDHDPAAEPCEDSRRLTGCNFFFAGTGAALEAAAGMAFDDATIERWRANVAAARAALDWPQGEVVVRRHRSGASLAFEAPFDQLYAATEVNEWAWWTALLAPLEGEGVRARAQGLRAYFAPAHAAVWDGDSALHTLRLLAAAESSPTLVALRDAAIARALPFLADDDEVSLGMGEGGRAWPAAALPAPAAVDWASLHALPVAVVPGSNGKTTTVRLVAAMARAQGRHAAHS